MAVEQPPPSSRSSAEETLAGQPDTPPATTKAEKENGKSFGGQGRLERMVSRPSTGMNKVRTDGKIELKQKDCYNELGFGYSTAKKWRILTIIFLVQVSQQILGRTVPRQLPIFVLIFFSDTYADLAQLQCWCVELLCIPMDGADVARASQVSSPVRFQEFRRSLASAQQSRVFFRVSSSFRKPICDCSVSFSC